MRFWRIGARKRASGPKVVVCAAMYLNLASASYFSRSRNCYNKLILTNGLSGCTSGRDQQFLVFPYVIHSEVGPAHNVLCHEFVGKASALAACAVRYSLSAPEL